MYDEIAWVEEDEPTDNTNLDKFYMYEWHNYSWGKEIAITYSSEISFKVKYILPSNWSFLV